MKLGRSAVIKKILGEIVGPLFAILILVLVGAYAFSYYENQSYFESLYFVVVSLSTHIMNVPKSTATCEYTTHRLDFLEPPHMRRGGLD